MFNGKINNTLIKAKVTKKSMYIFIPFLFVTSIILGFFAYNTYIKNNNSSKNNYEKEVIIKENNSISKNQKEVIKKYTLNNYSNEKTTKEMSGFKNEIKLSSASDRIRISTKSKEKEIKSTDYNSGNNIKEDKNQTLSNFSSGAIIYNNNESKKVSSDSGKIVYSDEIKIIESNSGETNSGKVINNNESKSGSIINQDKNLFIQDSNSGSIINQDKNLFIQDSNSGSMINKNDVLINSGSKNNQDNIKSNSGIIINSNSGSIIENNYSGAINSDIKNNIPNSGAILENSNSGNTLINLSEDIISASINKELKIQLEGLNNDIFNGFKIKILKDNNLVLEDGIWYTYIYSNYHNFGKGVIPSEKDLIENGLDKNTTILLLNESIGVSYITEYKKVKLISDEIIYDIKNKYEFLIELADDKKYLQEDSDKSFIELKNETLDLTEGLTQNNKVKTIYNYILRNITYSKIFDIDNKYIFSGISTYNNKNGVCSGYAKLNLYMLSFAGINYVNVVKGHVVDATDFPDIGHAWIKIGNKYYDPTFDDTGNNGITKNYSEYKYFGLPKDLFYTNRFEYGNLPLELRNADLETRKVYVKKELEKLKEKYIDINYNLLK